MSKRARQLINDQHRFFREMQLPSSFASRIEWVAIFLGGLVVNPVMRFLGIHVSADDIDLRIAQAIVGATILAFLLACLITLTGPLAFQILLGFMAVAFWWVGWLSQLDRIPRLFVTNPPSPVHDQWWASFYARSTPPAAPPPRLTCA